MNRHLSLRNSKPVLAKYVVLSLLLFLPIGASAAKDDVLTEDDYLGDVPVVLSATRLKQPRSDAPAAITVIDRKMIEASGALEIPDLFRLVPGFQVLHDEDQRIAVTYHGFSDNFARRLQVLIDGRSVYSPFFGGVDWNNLPIAIEDIERIEVIRGPNSATYGANAFLAVVNIITRHPLEGIGHTLITTAGDLGTRKVLYRHSGVAGKFAYRFSVGFREDEGILNFHDNKEIDLLTFRGEHQFDARNTLDVQFGINNGDQQTGDGDPDDPFRIVETKSSFQQVKWSHTVSSDEEFTLQFYHNNIDVKDEYVAIVSSFTLFNIESFITERFNLEFVHKLKPSRNLRLVWGAETRLDRNRAKGWFNTRKYRSNHTKRLFANAEWRFHPRWIMNVGALVEKNTFTGTDLSPRVALNFKVTPRHTFRFAVSRAYRTPSAFEERANVILKLTNGTPLDILFRSDGNTRPEEITETEIGYSGEFPKQNARVDFKLFASRIKNVIVIVTDNAFPDLVPFGNGRAGVVINGGSVKIGGAEVELQWKPTRKTKIHATASYARNRGSALSDINPTTVVITDKSTPVLTQSVMVTHEFPRRWHASVTWYKVSKVTFFGSGDDTGGFHTADWRIAKKLGRGKTRAEIALIGRNIGKQYFDYRDDLVLKKQFYLTLKLNF